jgi:hypothetical protein
MPHLGDISASVRLTDRDDPHSVAEMLKLVSALRGFRRQPPIELDGKLRVSYNSVQFMPSVVNIGFLDDIPWDIRVQPLNFCRYGICLPPDSVDEFHSYGFPHRIRSDCELTHFFEHVWYVLKPGGVCHFRATNLMELIERCADAKGRDNELHIIERQLFSGHDRSGLYFNQACLNKARLINRMRHAGFLRIEVEEDAPPDGASLPKEADQIWLRQFTPEQVEECLSGQKCVMPGCTGTRWWKLYRPTERSMYCKKHFRKAHREYLTALNRRLGIRWSSVKPEGRPRRSGIHALAPELAGETPVWRGAKADLGTVESPVSLTGEGATCTPETLLEMATAVREYRRLPAPDRAFSVSYNSDRFLPQCVNVGHLRRGWEWDVVANKIDFAHESIALPRNSVREFHCYGYMQRLQPDAVCGLAATVHACLEPHGRFCGSFNDLDAARRRFLEASRLSDPALASKCLEFPLLSPESLRGMLRSAGFVAEVRRAGGRYGSTEDILLPGAVAAAAGRMRFKAPADSQEGCCLCGKPRFWPQDGVRAPGVDPASCPSIYCRRHFTHAARALHDDIAQKVSVTFEARKEYRVSAGRRIRIR